jgi:pimeloyl-ACP methyl ester carboxylesterase
MTSRWARVRRIWAIAGCGLLVAWVGWCALAFRPNADARAAMAGSALVQVRAMDDAGWLFEPAAPREGSRALLFFPGGLVDARAYAPLLHAVAAAGHRAVLVRTPWRGAFGMAEDAAVLQRARQRIHALGGRWAVGGHSRGGKAAAAFARAYPGDVDALVLLGTSHPRDFSLADAPFAVVQVLGDHDPIASPARARANGHNLPAATSRIVLRGANHSQFGDYGFQPGDRFAALPRAAQRRRIADALLSVLSPPASALHEEAPP